jgi:tRNA(His) 5'-end guanylyltransferase
LMTSSMPLEERARKLVERYSLDYVVTFGSADEISAVADPSSVLYVSTNTAETFAGRSHWMVFDGQCYLDGTCQIPAR